MLPLLIAPGIRTGAVSQYHPLHIRDIGIANMRVDLRIGESLTQGKEIEPIDIIHHDLGDHSTPLRKGHSRFCI